MLRDRLNLNGTWQLAFDPQNIGLSAGWHHGDFPPDATTTTVPGLWNLVRPGYEGVTFYRRRFHVPPAWRNRIIRLTVGAANYAASCWINGAPAGQHEGGYTPFEIDITDLLRYGRENEVVIRVVDPLLRGEVDGIRLSETACAKETWYYRYGGIWGDVALEAVGPTRITDIFVVPDQHGRPRVHLLVTVEHKMDRPAAATVAVVALVPASETGEPISRAVRPAVLDPGTLTIACELELPGGASWSLENPRLYECRCALYSEDGEQPVDQTIVRFGLRRFDVRDGVFLLNGTPILLKGVLYQPNYPTTLAYPPSPQWPEQELRAIKAAGFNLVRFHVRPPHPCYLDLADRLGLLVYEETALAWIDHSPHFRPRCQTEVRETILRDRNHPSVVLWGLFNENQRAAKEIGLDLLHYARQFDPTRPIIDNSGATAALDQDGSWSDRTHVLPVEAAPSPLNDVHLYFGVPVDPKVSRWMLEAGSRQPLPDVTHLGYGTIAIARDLLPKLRRDGPIFVSELGCGGLPNLLDVATHYGEASPLVDAVETRGYRDAFVNGTKKRGLDEAFGGVHGIVTATQQLQAEGDARQVDALRGNPNVSGYVVTQFNDAAWECHAGLVDVWRQPKLALAALARANAPRRLVLTLPRHTWLPLEPIPIGCYLVDEVAALGHVTLVYEIEGQPVALTVANASNGITRFRRTKLPAPASIGRYQLNVTMHSKGREVASATDVIAVLPNVDWENTSLRTRLAGVALATPDHRLERLLGKLPVGLSHDRQRLLVTRPAHLTVWEWDRLLDSVSTGVHALVFPLTPASARLLSKARNFEPQLRAIGSIGMYVGWFHYVKDSTAFRDLPVNCLAGKDYALVVPHYSLDELVDSPPAGAFSSGRDSEGRPRFRWLADLQTISYRGGSITFCQYRVLDNISNDPTAAILMRNLLR